MAKITVVSPLEAVANANVLTVTLDTANQVPYSQGSRMVLVIENTSETLASLKIVGSKAGVVPVPRLGQTMDLSGGFSFSIAPKQTSAIALVNVSEYLKGDVTITGGTADHHAYIIEM